MEQSTGTRGKKEYKLKYQVRYDRTDQRTKLAYGKLRKPCALPPRYDPTEEGDPTPVVFDVQDFTAENDRCLAMMRKLHHRNVLHARTVMVYTPTKEAKSGIVSGPEPKNRKLFAWVEPYSGFLIDHLRSTQLGKPGTVMGNKVVLPTDDVRNIVRQTADGIEHIRICGYYHGNFSLESSYYFMDEITRDLIVKLTNFKEGNMERKPLRSLQSEDWHAVGRGVKRISDIAKEINEEMCYEYFECSQLDDLATMLLESAPGDIETTYMNVMDHSFFWERLERKKFFVYRIPMALKEKNFTNKLEECDNICETLPWGGTGDFDRVVKKMDQFRANKGRDAYDKYSTSDFVKCICGLYTHEFELKEDVDKIVQKYEPQISWKLYKLLPRPTPDKRWL